MSLVVFKTVCVLVLLDKIEKLGAQCRQWQSTLEAVQQARAEDRMQLQTLISDKVSTLALWCIVLPSTCMCVLAQFTKESYHVAVFAA